MAGEFTSRGRSELAEDQEASRRSADVVLEAASELYTGNRDLERGEGLLCFLQRHAESVNRQRTICSFAPNNLLRFRPPRRRGRS